MPIYDVEEDEGRGRTLRVPARNGYPPNFGARTLPYPPGTAILTGTRVHGYPAGTQRVPCRYPAPDEGTRPVPAFCCGLFSPCFSATMRMLFFRVRQYAYYYYSTTETTITV